MENTPPIPVNRQVLRFAIFYLSLLALFISIEWKEILALLAHIYRFRGGLLPCAFYIVTYLGLVAGALILYTSRSRFIRLTSYAFSLLFILAALGVKSVNGTGYGFHEATLLFYDYEFIFDSFSKFAGLWLPYVMLGILFLGGIAIACTRWLPRIRIRYTVITLLFVCSMWLILNRHCTFIIDRFPVVFKVPAITVLAWTKGLYMGVRLDPFFGPGHASEVKHLVMIVDESVRGDVLGINGSNTETTPYLEGLGHDLINFGVACSASNQSFSSHAVLLSGLRMNELPDRDQNALKNPNIFQYARAAGRKPIVITSQSTTPKNYLSRFDFETIESFISMKDQFPEMKEWALDHGIVDRLVEIIDSEEKTFIYVVKIGAHFIYEKRYPEHARVFAPTATADEGLPFTARREHVLNSYRNAVRWSVDDFFRALIPEIKDHDCMILYTSDHGQSLHATGAFYPHATVIDPPQQQANVPLFLIVPEDELRRRLFQNMEAPSKNRDRLSHFQIFPTMLYLMGYDRAEVTKRYGPTIFDAEESPQYFISGDLFARDRFMINRFDDAANQR